MQAIINNIAEHSIAHEIGLEKGDQLLTLNGHPVRDVIDYMFYSRDDVLEFKIQRAKKIRTFKIKKKEGVPLGIELKPFRTKTCRNKCMFSFVGQLPKKWKQVTGVPIMESYGLTETAPGAIGNPLNIAEWTGTLGLPIPSTEVAILDDRGSELPLGQVGEICIRGPQVMKGYWNRPDETAKVFTGDGWFRSGDMGFMDDRGFVKLTDRKKDMILVSGFNVYPNEVEDVAMMYPGVLEVAAVGIPDEKSGEAVKLVVFRKDPALTAGELIAHCRKHLTGYKRRRGVRPSA